MKPQAAMRASAGRFESAAGHDVHGIESVLKKHGAAMVPLFGTTEERVLDRTVARVAAVGAPWEDLSRFYHVDADDRELDKLSEELASHALVEASYVKPPVALPVAADHLNAMAPTAVPPPPATPDFTANQIYLNPSPAGIDARWAWTQAGGLGQGVSVIDIEGNWRFTHEDLGEAQGGIVGGTPLNDVINWRNHGTAVLGEYSGDRNAIGVTGISPQAVAMAISHGGIGSAAAINLAASRLRAGDVILLEMHRPGPRFSFRLRDDQLGYIAVEWWPDDFAAILNASRAGIIVVEAAGNGAENLDDALYQTPGPGFPAGWTNPFRRSNRDSGAIVVGAGAPPPGTHGRDHGPDRSRLDFSNWGALVDAQGWGREVTSCGYGNLQGGSNEDLWYTDTFSGTSSASPIVTGAIACLQGMARARGKPPLTPPQIRNCLRTTGAAQQDAPGRPATQRIGNRPDLRALATCAFGKGAFKELKELRKEKEKDFKEPKERKELLKEHKEKDAKEFKEGKDKEKEFKEHKEIKEHKDFKESKEKEKDKEKDKEIFEMKLREKTFERPATSAPAELGDRLAALEATVGELVHFISAEFRPDLSQSALEQDVTQARAMEAKGLKDAKDVEKLADA
jgi:hypothetical protein